MMKLKPCRKCGCSMAKIEYGHGYWFVRCQVCGTNTPYRRTQEEAAETWNNLPRKRVGGAEYAV